MIRIRFFITSLGLGGAEKALINLLQRLDSSLVRIDVVSLYDGVQSVKIPPNVRYRHILKKPGFLSRILMKVPLRLFVKAFLRGEYDYEVAFLEGWPTEVISRLDTSAKRYAFIHCDVSVKNPLAKIYRTTDLCQSSYKKYDKVCFVSKDCKEAFQRIYGDLSNAIVVHNLFAFDEMDLLSNEVCSDIPNNGLRLITVARLSREKGIDRLVAATISLVDKYRFELYIVGDGPERVNVEKMISDNNLRNIHIVGYKANPYPYYKKADLYVCPSLYEGYSTSCVESIHFRVPILTTRCSGMGEILEDGKFGLIVENSIDGLVDGLEKILNNPCILDWYRNNIEKMNKELNDIEQYYRLFGVSE